MKYFEKGDISKFVHCGSMFKWGTYHLYTGSVSKEPLWQWLSLNQCCPVGRFSPVCSMTTVSRIAILCVPILLLLLLLTQFNMFLQEHFLPLVPVSLSLRNTHPDVILSDPGGPLLVSMAELALLPPPVLPHPTCSPAPLPRLPCSFPLNQSFHQIQKSS